MAVAWSHTEMLSSVWSFSIERSTKLALPPVNHSPSTMASCTHARATNEATVRITRHR
jgi:hypothetical protein